MLGNFSGATDLVVADTVSKLYFKVDIHIGRGFNDWVYFALDKAYRLLLSLSIPSRYGRNVFHGKHVRNFAKAGSGKIVDKNHADDLRLFTADNEGLAFQLITIRDMHVYISPLQKQ